jgi:thiol-disulfide isomerase/thioredoxin
MRRLLWIGIWLALGIPAQAGSFTLYVSAPQFDEDVVSLYRYDDLFTKRKVFVVRNLIAADGIAVLTGAVTGTAKVQLRIGDHVADLFVRPGSVLHIEASPSGEARSLSGTTRMALLFKELDRMDINALTTDANDRIDAFVSEDLATDEVAGMQALTIERSGEAAKRDTATRPPTLFVTPVLSKARIDTFDTKMRRFYADVQDPWFRHYLEYGLAGLRVGVRTNDKELFERSIQGTPVHYDDPEYVRFLRTFFASALEQVSHDHQDSLNRANDKDAMRALFQRNDFLRTSDRLAELVMIDQLYLKHATGLVAKPTTERILADVQGRSTFSEHRTIAANMLWDLTSMRVGSIFPQLRLEDARGNPIDLGEQLDGPVCIALTAGWCTYCAVEINALAKLAEQYPDAVRVIVIGLDRELSGFNAYRKNAPLKDQLWFHAVAEQELRDQLRVRNLPVFFLLNDSALARSPAPFPSAGLAELFHQAQVQQQQDSRIKVWDD